MTIDEFKKNIAPHMKRGFVAMDMNTEWCYYKSKPLINKNISSRWLIRGDYVLLSEMFTIEPVEDWTKSLIEVGK